MYSLYWIHFKEHTDPLTEGYIGITKQGVMTRFSAHSKESLVEQIAQGAVVDVLFDSLTARDARILERSYRPEVNIGWNVAVGGGLPPSRKGVDCRATKLALSGNDRTDAQKQRAAEHSARMKGRVAWNKARKPATRKSTVVTQRERRVGFPGIRASPATN